MTPGTDPKCRSRKPETPKPLFSWPDFAVFFLDSHWGNFRLFGLIYLVYLRKFKLFWPRLLKKRVLEHDSVGTARERDCEIAYCRFVGSGIQVRERLKQLNFTARVRGPSPTHLGRGGPPYPF